MWFFWLETHLKISSWGPHSHSFLAPNRAHFYLVRNSWDQGASTHSHWSTDRKHPQTSFLLRIFTFSELTLSFFLSRSSWNISSTGTPIQAWKAAQLEDVRNQFLEQTFPILSNRFRTSTISELYLQASLIFLHKGTKTLTHFLRYSIWMLLDFQLVSAMRFSFLTESTVAWSSSSIASFQFCAIHSGTKVYGRCWFSTGSITVIRWDIFYGRKLKIWLFNLTVKMKPEAEERQRSDNLIKKVVR